jgi:tetratricopeptide (TPR) repeat protein
MAFLSRIWESIRTGSYDSRLVAVLFLAAVVQYLYSFGNDFVWDARDVLLNDHSVRDMSHWTNSFAEDLWRHVPREGSQIAYLGYYRPVVKIAHMIEYQLFGESPYGYNSVSVILNALVVVLSFLLVRGITGCSGTAFFAALLYSVNPTRVEAVSWAYSDAYLFSGFFGLASLYALQKKWYPVAWGTSALAMLSHEYAVVLPVLALIQVVLIERREGSRAFYPALGYLIVLAVYLGVRGVVVGAVPITSMAPLEWANTVGIVVLTAIKSLWVPDGWVTVYLFNAEHFGGGSHHAISAPVVLIGVCSIGLWMIYRRRFDYLYWYLWPFLWAAVMFNVGRYGEYLFAEKLLYISALGPAVLTALLVRDSGRLRELILALVILLVGAHFVVTWVRTTYWRDDITYLSEAVDFAPSFALGHYALGEAYVRSERYDDAFVAFQHASELAPDNSATHNNIGNIEYLRGNRLAAQAAWARAIAADWGNPMPHYNLGMLAEQGGDPGLALLHYRSFLDLVPDPPPQLVMRIRRLELEGRR